MRRYTRWILLALLIGGFVSPASAAEEVTYRSGGLQLKGYLSRPQGEGPFPAVIYNHGGPGGQIGGAPEETCEALAEAGFIGFSPIRRAEIPMEQNLQDVMSALEYLQGLPQVDRGRIGMMGFSRGGLLTFLAAAERSDLRAIVMMAAAPGRGHADQAFGKASRISAPALLIVAENDNVQADHVQLMRKFERALKSAGKDVTFLLYPPYGQDGHRMFFEMGSYWKDVRTFLKKHL